MPVPKEKVPQEIRDLQQHLRDYLRRQQNHQQRIQVFQEERRRRQQAREAREGIKAGAGPAMTTGMSIDDRY